MAQQREHPVADEVDRGVLRIIATIEQRYDIELEDADVFGVSTVDEVVSVVRAALDGAR
ncbi:MAG: phosphopantetheine-binding protein [Pseudonocardia sp.]|nr:phosphopantetheine-binding protein [Pseudonocardia sp.]